MPMTTLDPTTALIVVDLQRGFVGLPTVHPMAGVLAAAAGLAAAFRRHALPVVLVNVDGVAPGRTERTHDVSGLPPGWTELAPELQPAAADLRVTKRSWGAFTGTGLDARLRNLGVTQVVLAGVATSFGVESTARQAHDLGYNVGLALDAMTDLDAAAHENSVARIFPALGETCSAADVIDALDRR